MSTNTRAIIIVPLVVTLLISAVSGLSYLIVSASGIPARIGMPLGFRLIGLLALAIGFSLLVWLFRHRPPLDILASTYTSLTGAFTNARHIQNAHRTEPLIITGPHRFIRHPLYTAAILLLAGWWLLLDYTFLLFCTGFMTLWFSLVVAPFEEHELRALFGAQYETYARTTPRFLPSIRLRRPARPDK